MIVTVIFPLCLSAQNEFGSKIDPSLLAQARSGAEVELIVVFRERADLSRARHIKGKEAKGQYVFQQLRKQALQSQKRAISILKTNRRTYSAFYVVNAIHTTADLALIQQLAALSEVSQLQPNPDIQLDLPGQEPPSSLHFRNAIEWGLKKIGADQVWEMGHLGQGVVIGGQDTGYEWDHPSLKRQYRGWNGSEANHNFNWHDAIREVSLLHSDSTRTAADNDCGLDVSFPCDDHNHGTHTMGTMVGDDGQGNQIGVAPQAKWIGCRNMEQGYGSPASYIECFEWFLAPTDLNGDSPDPALAPHVINNSWSCPTMEGCTPENWELMEQVIANLKAAGIMVVVSAGNSGRSGCATVSAPAAMFAQSFSVGAMASNDTIAAFSSRGPVTVDGSGRMKPDIVAPGVGVRSSVRDSGYATFSGTSMAGPHVAGMVALIISANPALAGEVELIENIIRESAVPMTAEETCGEVSGMEVPNNTYGYGRIDAVTAVQKALLVSNEKENAGNQTVRVFPNPVSRRLHFSFEQWEGPAQLTIFNSLGQSVYHREWDLLPADVKPVDLTMLAEGIYFFHVLGDRREASGQFVKK